MTTAQQGHLREMALRCAAQLGWDDFSLERLAEKAGCPLSEVQAVFPSKEAFLGFFFDHIETTAKQNLCLEDLETFKDKLMELFFARFEALTPYKFWCQGVYDAGFWDPSLLRLVSENLKPYLTFCLEACLKPTWKCQREAYLALLGGFYVLIFRKWLTDTSPDSAQTLALMDRVLTQGLSFFQFFQEHSGK